MTARRLTYANVASTVALVVALGGGGTAVAAGLAKNSVGSKQIKTAAVKKADLAPRAVDSTRVVDDSLTGADVAESSLAKVPAAARADTATTADSATTAIRAGNVHAAVVDGDGTLITGQSLDAVSATRLATGQYEVLFDRNVVSCTYVASLSSPGTGTSVTGVVSTTGRSGKPNGVWLATRDLAGAFTDKSFALTVVC